MSTNARIGVQIGENRANTIYCHWDGYIDYVGRILETCYNDIGKAKELISYGDLSSIGPIIGEKIDFDNPEGKEQCVFYIRDRGEDENEVGCQEMSIDELRTFEAYNYLYIENCGWFVSCTQTNNTFEPLEEILW